MNARGELIRGMIAWGIFFATSTFGHAALKRATGASIGYDLARSFDALFSRWGAAALWLGERFGVRELTGTLLVAAVAWILRG